MELLTIQCHYNDLVLSVHLRSFLCLNSCLAQTIAKSNDLVLGVHLRSFLYISGHGLAQLPHYLYSSDHKQPYCQVFKIINNNNESQW